jgi:predicted Zn-dependent protease
VKAWFEALADRVCRLPGPGVERVTLHVASEVSDFVRFNRGAVRQMTHVEQHEATLTLIDGQRRLAGSVSLSGDAQRDADALLGLRSALAADLPMVPPDPHLLMPDTVTSTLRDDEGAALAPLADIVAQVLGESAGQDLVGFYAAGPVVAAFADSRGQRNWHRVRSFHMDWSLYFNADPAVRDRAVKSIYAGARWDPAEFSRRMESARQRLALLGKPAHKLTPGAFRVWLEPAAVAEILGTLGWGGFGLKARRTGTSTLAALESGAARLSPEVHLSEATGAGLAPAFTATGHVTPEQVPLIVAGRSAQALVSPRSAAEFHLPANAGEDEVPASLSLAGGSLDPAGALAALDTGLWIGNLWYLGYSDRQSCRMTGMTRFASFRVEAGEIVAPIGVMRFDDSFLRLFGESLVALSREVELLPSNDTYGRRHLGSITAPGALLADMRFTL